MYTSLPTNNRLVWRSRRFFGSRIDKIANPALRRQVARNELHVLAKLVFEDGVFHWAIEHASSEVCEVLLQMPARQAGKSRLDTILYELDARIRARNVLQDA